MIRLASPASGKLGLRMTTLHEEPSSRHTLTEEVEENYSDSELNQFDESAVRKPPLKSRFPTSKTMGSLRDIGSSYQSMCSTTSITSNNVTKNVRKNATNASNKQPSGTPSMTSSTSSGYGSQVRLTLFWFCSSAFQWDELGCGAMLDATCSYYDYVKWFFWRHGRFKALQCKHATN